MNISQIKSRAEERLAIGKFTPLQQAMATEQLPLRGVLLAPTGSGKTLAFAIPLLRSLDAKAHGLQALVIAPTRELVLQVADVLRALAKPDFTVAAFYGGHSVEAEVNALSASPAILVSTPGRLLDHLRRGHFTIGNLATLVLDEYDKSLDLGFLPDIKAIMKRVGFCSSIILTSATALAEIPECFGKAQFKTFDYTLREEEVPDINFMQVESAAPDKLDTLKRLLRDLGKERVIVFVNHRDAAERVYTSLKNDGFAVGLYHGGLEQDRREKALVLFANGTTPVLIATDLASRGLDIAGVDAVIHYHLPVSEEAMTHRNGRTGRMGASGKAYAIISAVDKIPDFFPQLSTYWPEGSAPIQQADTATLYINAGKREKISKGDIAGYLIQKGGLSAAEVGKIEVRDHWACVAVPASKAAALITTVQPYKLKNTRVKLSRVE